MHTHGSWIHIHMSYIYTHIQGLGWNLAESLFNVMGDIEHAIVIPEVMRWSLALPSPYFHPIVFCNGFVVRQDICVFFVKTFCCSSSYVYTHSLTHTHVQKKAILLCRLLHSIATHTETDTDRHRHRRDRHRHRGTQTDRHTDTKHTHTHMVGMKEMTYMTVNKKRPKILSDISKRRP